MADLVFASDQPIERISDDRLGRRSFAVAIARQVSTAEASDGFAVGMVGPWGSGKTSILNMVRESLGEHDDIVVVAFNPWLFSGTEQLVLAFFRELIAILSSQSDKNLRSIAGQVEKYAELVGPLSSIPEVGKFVSVAKGGLKFAGSGLRKLGRDVSGSAERQRAELRKRLRESDKRVVVILDDIDRLRADEVQEVVRLVRLTADFPNTVYLLAFDRARVEECLDEGVPGRGRSYLAKIIQVIHDVPETRPPNLADALLGELAPILESTAYGPFNEERWLNLFHLVMRPLFQSLRDIDRYVNALPVTLQVVGDEVALEDLLTIEAVRVQLPDVFAKLPASIDALTSTWAGHDDPYAERRRSQLTEILASAGSAADAADPVRQLLERVFPASASYLGNVIFGAGFRESWRRQRLIAHPSVLRFYLEKTLPPNALPASKVDELFSAFPDLERLTQMLDELTPDLFEDALGRLEAFEEDFPPDTAGITIEAFLNKWPGVREGSGPMLSDWAPSMKLTRVVYQLLRHVDDESERLRIVEHTQKHVSNLSGRFELLRLAGHRENTGHGLIPQAEAHRLEQKLIEDLVNTDVDALLEERDLGRLLMFAAAEWETGDGAAKVREILGNDALLLQTLRSLLSESQSSTMGDVAVRRQFDVPWKWLGELLGEDFLISRVEQVGVSVEQLEGRTAIALAAAQDHARRVKAPSQDVSVRSGEVPSIERLRELGKIRPGTPEYLERIPPPEPDPPSTSAEEHS